MVSDRELAYEMLYEVFEKEGFSNLVLKNRETTGFVSAMFYGTITRSYTIDFLLKHIAKVDMAKADPSTRTILRMGVWQLLFSSKTPSFAAVDTAVKLAHKLNPKSASYVNAILRKISSADIDIDSFKPEIQTSLKPEIFGVLKKSYGRDEALAIGKALLESPKISIRTNILKTDTDKLLKILMSEGVSCKRSDVLKDSIIIEGTNIETLQSFKDGLFFVQNEAAQWASIIASPSKGMKILDCCAAPGGKSTHLAELTGDDCEILSLDINESRLKLIDENSKRLGINSIKTKCFDSTSLDDSLGSFDMVLCDVPCSGLGLMSRKPDIRLTISYERIEELLPRQRDILMRASGLVRPGGKLIYCTCTLNRKENEETIQDFLTNNSEFVASDITDIIATSLIMNEERETEASQGMLTLFPHIDGCDGFFICKLERRA